MYLNYLGRSLGAREYAPGITLTINNSGPSKEIATLLLSTFLSFVLGLGSQPSIASRPPVSFSSVPTGLPWMNSGSLSLTPSSLFFPLLAQRMHPQPVQDHASLAP